MAERLRWPKPDKIAAINEALRRYFDVVDAGLRYDVQTALASTRIGLSNHRTFVKIDTTGGAVTITLPRAAEVIGYRVEFKVIAGIASATVAGNGTDLIDNASTQGFSLGVALISDGANWWSVT